MESQVVIPAGKSPADVASYTKLTHFIYALHALSIFIGITTAATIVGAFLFGLPSIAAVILNYIKRPDVAGTFLESHFRWQIRTFWFAALWFVVGLILFIPLALTLIGIPLAFGIFVVIGVWAIYRIARGWLALNDNRPMPM
jgi:uncharacterized membrane protein